MSFTDKLYPFPIGVFSGTRAITSQSYTEANVKNGLQFEFSNEQDPFAAGATIDFIIITGNLPILIKSIEFQYNGTGFRHTLYRNPVYTGGTNLQYYNKDTRSLNSGSVQILGGATVTDPGTQVGSTKRMIGSKDSGNNKFLVTRNIEPGDLETVLASNSVYMYRRVSVDTEPQVVSSNASWYEGELDLPIS